MPYVSRGEANSISGVFNAAQPGFAEEYLPDDDPEVVAYLNPPPAPPEPKPETTLLYDHENRLRLLEGVPPLSLGDFTEKVRDA